MLKILYAFLGIESASVSHTEKLISGLGGALAIACLYSLSYNFLDVFGAAVLVASMGASAVLLFAVPHGPLSQPWPLLGGHVISAFIGVSCARFIPFELLAAAASVGLSISVMYYLRCVHPPGGATALSAVIGGGTVQTLGYQFVITPVLINVLAIFAVALSFNYLFKWRCYPNYWRVKQSPAPTKGETFEGPLSHGDLVYALERLDSFVDIGREELQEIYRLAVSHADEAKLHIKQVHLGGYYSNCEYGKDWAVRRIVDESPHADPDKDLIVYKTVAGANRRSSGYMTRQAFTQWAKCELMRDENNWKRMDDT